MQDIFHERNVTYRLWFGINIIYYGTEPIRILGPNIWNLLTNKNQQNYLKYLQNIITTGYPVTVRAGYLKSISMV